MDNLFRTTRQWSTLCFVLALLFAPSFTGGLPIAQGSGKPNFGTTYTSPDGWNISWDRATWQAVDTQFAATSTFELDLTGAASIVSMRSQPNTGGTAKACVWEELLALQEPASTQDFSAPPQLQSGDDAQFSADFSYVFAFPNASTIALSGSVQCLRNWPKDGTDFVVRQIAPNAAYPDADTAFTDLLSALTAPPQAPATVVSAAPHELTHDEASTLADLIPVGLGIWWTSTFLAHGRVYTPPGYATVANGPVADGCGGKVSPADSPFYCDQDNIVYLTADRLANRSKIGGIGTVSYVAAHESAHNVEQQFGLIGNPDPAQDWPDPIIELTADCLAGAFMRQEVDLQALTEDRFFQVLNMAHNLGGPSPGQTGADHGTQAERFFITYLGFSEGVDSCSIF
jgi:predicted metalloprotease